MSYCVNCGVELAESEKRCPLCQVEVANPAKPWQEPRSRPYSPHVDRLMKKIDRRYFASLAGLLMAVPWVITVFVDMIGDGRFNWSAYVIGGAALLYIFIFLPFFFNKHHPVLFPGLDCLAVLLYLLLIERMSGGAWFFRLGLPLTLAAGVCVIGLALLFSKKHFSLLKRAGDVLAAVGLFVVWAELIIRHYVYGAYGLSWSIYALVPCLALAAAMLILEHRNNFKEKIRRRLFY